MIDQRDSSKPIAQKETLVVRESRTTAVIALLVCVILLSIGSFSLGGPFHFAAIGFMILITLFISLILWSATFVTVFTTTGLHGRTFGKRWKYLWGDIASWGLEYNTNGEYLIWFEPKGAKKRHFVQSLGDDVRMNVREYFEQYCDDPQIDVSQI